MPIKVTCANCGGVLHAPDDAGGKRGRCPTCGNILPIPAEAPRAAALPDAPSPKSGARPPSFGDFALGPQVDAPPGGAPDPLGMAPPLGGSTASPVRASATGFGEPRKASKPAEEPRPANDPFARKGKGSTTPAKVETAPGAGTVKAWQKSRSGLWWVRAGLWLYLIPAVLLPGYYLADALAKAFSTAEVKADLVPDKMPGMLGIPGISLHQEIPLLGAGIPILLGLILTLLGRLSFSSAPRRSGVGGPALLATLATTIALAGALALVFPNIALNLDFNPPAKTEPGVETPPDMKVKVDDFRLSLFTSESLPGMLQRFGIFFGIAALVVGEFWFASAIGRVGSALGDRPTAARSTRYLFLLGLAVILLVGTAAIAPSERFGIWGAERNEKISYSLNPATQLGRETNGTVADHWKRYVSPELDKLGAYRPALAPGLALLGGLLVGCLYLRMTGAARRAIRDWLQTGPVG